VDVTRFPYREMLSATSVEAAHAPVEISTVDCNRELNASKLRQLGAAPIALMGEHTPGCTAGKIRASAE
jgi:hypothetical protein